MVYANGIGPINKSFNKRLTHFVLNQVDVITLREDLSRIELDLLKISKPQIIVTADPALTVEAVTEARVSEIFEKEGIDIEGPFIGFSARICENNMKYDEGVLAKAADYVYENYNSIPVFIPMQPVDLKIIESIVSKMSNKGYVIRGDYEVNDILGVISKMQMLVGMRLHSLIYAANLGVPIIGLVYDPKVEGFLQYIHQASAGHVKDLDIEKMKSVMDEVWNGKSTIKKQLEIITSKLKDKAMENARIAVELIDSVRER
jgi:L-malate glycosyltransferase